MTDFEMLRDTAERTETYEAMDALSEWLESNGDAADWNGESWDLRDGKRLVYIYQDDESSNVVGYRISGSHEAI